MHLNANGMVRLLGACILAMLVCSCSSRQSEEPRAPEFGQEYMYFLPSFNESDMSFHCRVRSTGPRSRDFIAVFKANTNLLSQIVQSTGDASVVTEAGGGEKSITNAVFGGSVSFPFTAQELAACPWWTVRSPDGFSIRRYHGHAPARAILDVFFLIQGSSSNVFVFGSSGD